MKGVWNMKKSNLLKYVVLLIMVAAMCLTATGCMGGQKDIKNDEAAVYTEMVAAACEEYGYEYEEQTVLPKGSALVYVLSNDESDGLDIRVTINEESTYEYVGCEFELERAIAAADDNTGGLDQHLPVMVKIVEHFTDEISVDDVADYLNDSSLWKEGKNDDEPFMYKDMTGNLQHIIEEDGEEYEEYFFFGWDNGQKYKLKQDK